MLCSIAGFSATYVRRYPNPCCRYKSRFDWHWDLNENIHLAMGHDLNGDDKSELAVFTSADVNVFINALLESR